MEAVLIATRELHTITREKYLMRELLTVLNRTLTSIQDEVIKRVVLDGIHQVF